jgi:hypothetical protein
MATASKPERLHYTGNDEADRLIAGEPFELLVGFALDQQVPFLLYTSPSPRDRSLSRMTS